MINMKKGIVFLFAMMLLFSNSVYVHAEESLIIPQSNGTTDIRLDMLKVTVPYDSRDIEVEYVKDSAYVKAIILDKETKEELERYTEFIEPAQMSIRSTKNTVWRTIMNKKSIKPASVEACARVEIYSSGSFRQINEVKDVWQRPGNSGSYTLEDKRTFCETSLPSTKIRINASGNVVVKSSTSVGADFSFEFLKSCNFSMSGSVSDDWHARKGYDTNITLDVY